MPLVGCVLRPLYSGTQAHDPAVMSQIAMTEGEERTVYHMLTLKFAAQNQHMSLFKAKGNYPIMLVINRPRSYNPPLGGTKTMTEQ